MDKPKISTKLKNQLFSANTDEVIATVNTLKEKGNKEYLPLLFELLRLQPEAEIQKEILQLLGSIKDKETIPVFIEAIEDEKFSSIKKTLLNSCWQSGLDFSKYLNTFVDVVINEEWEVAFEAFTVIENLENFPPEEEIKNIKLKAARALKISSDQKAYFLEEILKLLP
jgi:hypothetical protein